MTPTHPYLPSTPIGHKLAMAFGVGGDLCWVRSDIDHVGQAVLDFYRDASIRIATTVAEVRLMCDRDGRISLAGKEFVGEQLLELICFGDIVKGFDGNLVIAMVPEWNGMVVYDGFQIGAITTLDTDGVK